VPPHFGRGMGDYGQTGGLPSPRAADRSQGGIASSTQQGVRERKASAFAWPVKTADEKNAT